MASQCSPSSSPPPSPCSVVKEGNRSHSNINMVRFNQDCTSLSLASTSGYKLFHLASIDRLEPIYAWNNNNSKSVAVVEGETVVTSETTNPTRDQEDPSVHIVERLFSSSLLALVTKAEPRKLKVCHFKKGTEICNYSYSDAILSVRLNRARLIVCLEESLYLHNIRDMKILHTIRDTPANPRGLCALSINSDNCYLAYPGSNSTGEVQLFDAFNLQAKMMIPAHESPLAALAFNPSGTRLATASEKGTVIRVFSVEEGTKLIEFRRGVKRCATVYCLAFSQDSQYLVLSSNTETIHIFKFVEEEPIEESQQHQHQQAGASDDTSWMGYLSKAVSTTASYLPTQVTDTLNQSRAFSTVTVQASISSAPNTVAIAAVSRQQRLLLASADGYLYIYNLPLPGSEGGECTLVKQHRIDPDCTVPVPIQRHPEDPVRSEQRIRKDSEDEDDFGPASSPSSPSRPAILDVIKGQQSEDE